METQHIDIVPMPTPRPRVGKHGAYNTPKYTQYKRDLGFLLKALHIPKDDYGVLYATFAFPFPKTVKGGEKAKIEYLPMRDKCDCDNLSKGLMDALESVGIIEDDRQIYELHVSKLRTNTGGYIKFRLEMPTR